jgi:TPR repeat protein|tara:strand:- start:288 stop:602 length:315 start_codon:yes stop_codon:yes gene_type:complete
MRNILLIIVVLFLNACSPTLTDAFNRTSILAEKGNAIAQFNLGIMYHKGKGVTQDNKLAYMWYSIAASSGNEPAIEWRDKTAKKMSASQLKKAQDMAGVWVAKP